MNLSLILNTAHPHSHSSSYCSSVTGYNKPTSQIHTLLNTDYDPVEPKVKRRRLADLNEPPSSPISAASSVVSPKQLVRIASSIPLSLQFLPQTYYNYDYDPHYHNYYHYHYQHQYGGEESAMSPTEPVGNMDIDIDIAKEVPPLTISPESYLGDTAGRRLSQARLVGLRHRKNERLRSESLELDISTLEEENAKLRSEVAAAKRRNGMNINITHNLTSYSNSTTISISGPPRFMLSSASSQILGVSSVDGSTALLFLELIALRRNMETHGNATNFTLEAPKAQAVLNAVRNSTISTTITININSGHEEMHARWAHYEANFMATEEKSQAEKRCTRCAKLRSAGSGHPRSSCDDGFKVASDIPYRPIPPKQVK